MVKSIFLTPYPIHGLMFLTYSSIHGLLDPTIVPVSKCMHTVGQATESTLTFLFQLIAMTSGAVKREDVVTLFEIRTISRNVEVSIRQGINIHQLNGYIFSHMV